MYDVNILIHLCKSRALILDTNALSIRRDDAASGRF